MNVIRLVVLAMLLAATVSSAQAAVRIVTQNGNVITGDLVSFQNGVYMINTPFGPMTIPAASVKSIEGDPSAPPHGPTDTLRLAGSTTVGDELAPSLLEAFAESIGAPEITTTQGQTAAEIDMVAKGPQNASMTAHLSRLGSGTAFTALADHSADIGMASRRINPAEAARLSAAGLGDFTQPGFENVLALDGLIVVVNQSNPINSISLAKLRDLFTGHVTDWSQVGGKPGAVHLYGRDSKSGTADTFNALVLSGAHPAGGIITTDGSEDLTLKVLGDPGGIGYTGFAYRGDNKALSIVTDCGLEFAPADLLVRTEEYPLSRRLFLYAPLGPGHEQARAFIDFALSPAGQEIARKNNFIDLIPQLAPVQFGRSQIALDLVGLANDAGATPDDKSGFMDYARRVTNGSRISTTLCFQTGSSSLDSRAVRDIDRLADLLKSPVASKRHILVAGFADSVGSSPANRVLSQTRARAVASLLQGKGVPPAEVVGYGRVAPVACNTDVEGGRKTGGSRFGSISAFSPSTAPCDGSDQYR